MLFFARIPALLDTLAAKLDGFPILFLRGDDIAAPYPTAASPDASRASMSASLADR
jgi:hypothetical protein